MLLTTGAAMAVKDLPGGPAVNQLNLHPPVTKIAADQMWLHNFMLILCLGIFVAVFGVMFYSIFKHRKSKGAVSANFHESVAVEIAWTVVPFIIVIAMALPATKVVVAMKDTTNADLTIKATGYQWKWGYDYLKGEGEGIGFLSTLDTAQREQSDSGKPEAVDNYLLKVDNPLVVPVGKKVRIITTANDVIHAFMVPAFGIKQDAIPGFVRDTWFKAEQTGDFYGQCAELCGKEHGYMPIVVEVKTQADYDKWVAAQRDKAGVGKAAAVVVDTKTYSREELVAHGKTVYEGAGGCQGCHQPTGKGVPGSFPALDGSKIVNGPKDGQINILLNGKPGTAMAAFKHLNDKDLAGDLSGARDGLRALQGGADGMVVKKRHATPYWVGFSMFLSFATRSSSRSRIVSVDFFSSKISRCSVPGAPTVSAANWMTKPSLLL